MCRSRTVARSSRNPSQASQKGGSAALPGLPERTFFPFFDFSQRPPPEVAEMEQAQQCDANKTGLFGTGWLLQSAMQNAACNRSATNKVAVPCPVQARWPVNDACHALSLLTSGHGPPPECIRSLPESPALVSRPMLFPSSLPGPQASAKLLPDGRFRFVPVRT
ncbi:hypothetical protein DL98DRAFT_538581 [Cadophora sp. DSE1049]|nr:hypothetical protein DL98DRAFT_538581 [Cadophora sp. DSE1049]